MRQPPNQPPPILNWDRYRIFGLFLLAAYAFRFGLYYTPLTVRHPSVPIPAALEYITALFPDARPGWEPVWILGGLWILGGVATVLAMVWHRIHNMASIGIAVLTLYWAAAYIAGSFLEYSRENVSAAAVLLFTSGMVIYIGLTSRPAEPLELEQVTLEPVTHRVE